METTQEVKQLKCELRNRVQTVLETLTPQQIQQQSKQVLEKVLSHPSYRSSRSVSLYLSTNQEIDTVEILKDALKQNKQVYVPRYSRGKTDMEMVRLHSYEDFEALPVTKWNIKQPKVTDVREDVFEKGSLDLILLPGVAFTLDGARLGHGKGYYDRFLARCKKDLKSPYPVTIGLALLEQIYPEIPVEDTDQTLDHVLTA